MTRRALNRKRKLAPSPTTQVEQEALVSLAERVSYQGSPYHKRNPGDFGLSPPINPRSDKSLCDDAGISRRPTRSTTSPSFGRSEAEDLLREGVKRGLVSMQRRGDFPQRIWGVAENGRVVEAQLENEVKGSYHGYPMQDDDPLVEEVRRRWQR